jgi:hypothetical protein
VLLQNELGGGDARPGMEGHGAVVATRTRNGEAQMGAADRHRASERGDDGHAWAIGLGPLWFIKRDERGWEIKKYSGLSLRWCGVGLLKRFCFR